MYNLGSDWKYFVGTQGPSSPATAWRERAFDDTPWQTGRAPIGYGESGIATAVPSGTLNVYFRKTFVIADPSQASRLDLTIRIDDGFVVWINGTEVGRYNVPAGELPHNSLATSAFEPDSRVLQIGNPGAFLVPGTNVIAILALNGSTTSSDIYMDSSLFTVEPDPFPPTIESTAPVAGTLTQLSSITVNFNEAVTGVEAKDLLINGIPAGVVTTNTPASYTFSFPQPAFGEVQVTWSASHGIADYAFPPNPFSATRPGATWQYLLEDRTAPTAVTIIPRPGFTVLSLSSIEIRFSEAVTGVEAGDLMINGNAAAAVATNSSANYTFTFPQPATGTVQIAWSANHGITDLAIAPNSYAARAPWNYTLDPNAPLPEILITEFVAAATRYRGTGEPPPSKARDEDGDYPDWIEIFNSGELEVNLDRWSLTDSANRWRFPATNLPPKEYMVIFASGKDRSVPGQPLHTNFRLEKQGELLALLKPDGTVASSYSPTYPPQIDDVAFGLPTLAIPTSLITDTNDVFLFLPNNDDLALSWTLQSFNHTTWTMASNGVGYERATNPPPSLRPFINSDIESSWTSERASIFLRIPFQVDNAKNIDVLKLMVRYDDGFVAYVNGQEVARRNASGDITIGDPLPVTTRAGVERANNLSTNVEELDLTFVAREGGLQTGSNILAIHAFNHSANDGDFLIAAELTALRREMQADQTRYFTLPTPGEDNGPGVENLGPIISSVNHTPKVPADNEDIVVTARLTSTFAPVSSVVLYYRVMYGSESNVPMLDDGQHSDGAANDGVYGATIPASGLSNPGQMVRWYIRATDTQSRTSREPGFLDPNNSPAYFGTVVYLEQTNNLPILQWFMENPSAAQTDAGARGSLFYLDEFYDNIYANLHGQSSRGFPKKSYDIDFNPGNNFRFHPDEEPVDDINLLTTYPDKAKMRNMLSYRIYKDAGAPYHWVIPVRVHTNGQFFGDWHMVENGDENFLERLGKDPRGALYKMYNTFTDPVTDVLISSSEAEKKSRKEEGNADLIALMNGIRLGGDARNAFFYDNVNIPQMINYLAARILTGDTDCCHKNYYFYRNSTTTGEWEGFPWDVDLSIGRVWNGTDAYWNHQLIPTTGLNIGNNNGLFSYLITGTPETRQMYLRRIRTLMDEILGPPTAPLTNIEEQVDYWTGLVAPDAALDAIKYPTSTTWGNATSAGRATSTCCPQTQPQAAAEIKNSYLPQRRQHMYSLSEIPAAQPADVIIHVRSVDFSPSSGNQAEEYIELVNSNSIAVDISGWKMSGGIEHTFQGGVVIPANGELYLARDVNAWRARTKGPGGGRGLFVQGNFQGQLSSRGEAIHLSDKGGRLVSSLTYAGAPSLAQDSLRVTEIMYSPVAETASTLLPEEFEYLELKNIGTNQTSLLGVRFISGIDFDFSTNAVTTLEPGQSVLVVRNRTAFEQRYGTNSLIAGQYAGLLDNAGERIRLVDASGEEILDFSYNNTWYPITDGVGFSLVIVDENADPDDWNRKSNWRPSYRYQGTPGGNEPPAPTFSNVLVNEVLTRTLAVPDAIEIFNPTTNQVDVGGWYLTDDFMQPHKFRIPAGTTIPAESYLVFDENDFNGGSANNFALSSNGDEVYLFGVETGGELNGYFHGFEFGAAEEEVSFGRYLSSDEVEHFVRQQAVTLGSENAGPRVGPIIISEIMYRPVDIGTNDNSVDEYIELQNISSSAVALFDATLPTNTWRISGGVDFTFPANITLAPAESIVIVSFSPTNEAMLAAFRNTYSAASVRVFGPYTGELNNNNDRINLLQPTPIVDAEVPYALIERVEYSDSVPWPKAADGIGFSLQRWLADAFGNDPINWVAAPPAPGTATLTNGTPPHVDVQPQSQTLLSGRPGFISAEVSGSEPMRYQWRHNGTNLPAGTNLILNLANITMQNAGEYELVASNPFGAIFSDIATVGVRDPVVILQQPQTIDVRVLPDPLAAPTTNKTFSVSAFSVSPIQYQWRRNGVNIPDATNDTYTVVDVTTNDLARFTVVVSDEISTVESDEAWLYPLVNPTFLEAPISQSVPVGSPVTLSAVVSGFPPPFTFEWRLGSAILQNTTHNEPVSFFTLTAPATVTSTGYRVIVRNRARPNGLASGFATITTLADSDNNGISDQWETAFGTSGRDADPDSDGLLNWQEFLAGTDPTNSLSTLKLESSDSTNALQFEFQAISNRTYAVQFKPSIELDWIDVSRMAARRTNRTEHINIKAGTSNGFYRVVTPVP